MGYDCSTDSSLNSSAYTELGLGNADVDPFLLQFLAECSKNAYGKVFSSAKRELRAHRFGHQVFVVRQLLWILFYVGL